jgi:hypothetical protein
MLNDDCISCIFKQIDSFENHVNLSMASKIFYRNSFEYILTIPEEKCNRLIKDDCFYNAIKKYKEIHYLQLKKNFIHTSNNNLNNINNIIMYKHKP